MKSYSIHTRWFAILLLYSLVLPLSAQTEQPAVRFGSPFGFPLFLSGNFGELRSAHFHGGIDVKTQGVVDKPIRAIAEGYISRVTVRAGGYGNALYITHTNGYTSVYGHLNAFLPEVSRRIRNYQEQNETFETELEFAPDEFPVQEGQVVALSGNTGYSMGPHLHMEIRQTDTNEPIDPLPFYQSQLKDRIAPRASYLMLSPAKGEGVLNGSGEAQVLRIHPNETQVGAGNALRAWGKIGAAISAYDFMDGTSNRYGVHTVRLFVDNVLVSTSTVNRFSFDENRLVDAWVDVEERRRTGCWFMRSFQLPGNDLRMLQTGKERGYVTICEPRDYHFRYELSDLYGNTSIYRFVVKGSKQPIPATVTNYFYYLSYNRPNSFSWTGLSVWLEQGALYDNLPLDFEVIPQLDAPADIYRLCATATPLHKDAEIRLQVRQPLVAAVEKYYLAEVDGSARYYLGGTYRYGWLKAEVNELSSYTVCVDTIPPLIQPVNPKRWKQTGKIVFLINDGQTGIRSYRGTLDGQWVLFRYSAKNASLTCSLKEEGIRPGHHRLQLQVTDLCGNIRTYEQLIE